MRGEGIKLHLLDGDCAAAEAIIAFEDVRPRRLGVAAIKLDLLERRKRAVEALCEPGGVYRLPARAHAPDREARKGGLGGHDEGWVCGEWQDCEVDGETELA